MKSLTKYISVTLVKSMSDFYETHKAMLPDDILRKLIIVSILVPDLFVYQNVLKKVKKGIWK